MTLIVIHKWLKEMTFIIMCKGLNATLIIMCKWCDEITLMCKQCDDDIIKYKWHYGITLIITSKCFNEITLVIMCKWL